MALELARVLNKHSKPFKAKYDNQTYLIKPNSETIVPLDAVCLWMGNPSSVDYDEKRRDRSDEYRRLRAKYGVYEHDDRMEENLPRLEAYTLDGERIWTVLEDPEGEHAGSVTPPRTDDDAVAAQILSMQQQIDALQAVLKVRGVEPREVRGDDGEGEDDGQDDLDDPDTLFDDDQEDDVPPSFTADDPRRILT